jgi:CheY-like chemotaxis protein
VEGALDGKKVLVVDDDVRNIFALTSLLEDHHLQVVHAENGRAGIEVLKKTPNIDLVLMDIMMPGMDGWQATRELRANGATKDIPILAATALFRDTDLKSCIDAGCNGYIVKPFTFQELQGKVRELIPATDANRSL